MYKNNTKKPVKRNAVNVLREQNRASDLQKISSRIICSANITRQSLNNEPVFSVSSDDDDDDQFFENMKSEIDKDNFLNSKRKTYNPYNYQSCNQSRNKRPIVDEETENVIKRFKKDTGHKNDLKTVSNESIVHSTNSATKMMKEIHIVSTDSNNKSVVQKENIFSSNILNTNIRNYSNEHILQMRSMQANNVLSSHKNNRTIIHTKYEEFLCYELTYLTPPSSNSCEDDEAIEM